MGRAVRDVLSLVERFVWDEEVACSNHVVPRFSRGGLALPWYLIVVRRRAPAPTAR